ncbi:hypothetical protein B7P43_G09986 [Cryptotermes secundus]|uniref:Major facilitator superfamily (MFS) profile domain-containing protein n=1 Tax=Cryptotermes secundus TaxID=105785 RepID=A0A2J7RGY5_9NEOP|nr:uncharacterized transporter slc-17.2 isoform X3 [Cryptotermes secundus]PNF40105.1 hypothetical protein B7P43_G09986 [Cryptotermes secundus]
MAAFGKLKRGSVQLQRAAIKASGRIGARHVMVGMVVLGLLLSGFVERSASVALLSLSDPLSSADFAEYVTNTSYVTQYCASFNDTNDLDVGADPEDGGLEEEITDFEQEDDDSFEGNGTTHVGHGRHIVADPPLKGSTWPALHMLAASWFPPLQRSGFVSCYSAVSVGHAMAGLLGTPLVLALGRDSLCYLLATLTLLWAMGWWILVRESPAEHPRLSDEQRRHLQRAIGPGLSARNAVPPPPWRRLLSSLPVWACAMATLGSHWGQATLQLAVTKYLMLVYGFALRYDRVLSVLPHFGHFLAALTFGRVVDHVRGQALVSTTTARKLLVYISHFLPGAVLFVVGYSGCDPATPAAIYTAAVVVSGATAAGVYSSAVDVAPNFAGTVFGLSQTFGAAGSLAASYVVKEGLHGSLPGSWRLVFGVAAFVLAFTATVFMAIGSGSVQPWNYSPNQRAAAQEPASEDEAEERETAASSVVVDTASVSQQPPETSSTTKAATMTTAL